MSASDTLKLAERLAGGSTEVIFRNVANLVHIENLSSRKRFSEAARVFIDYCEDIEGGLSSLVQGNNISEALRLVSKVQSMGTLLS
jgi:hypothetical protein